MKTKILGVFAIAITLASCSATYRQAQTPDDVYYSPGKEKQNTYASARDNRRDNSDYDDYASSSEDQYLRMKIQDRNRWGALDDYDYWSSPGYAYNNYYGYNSFNPFMFNSWGLSFYYSPFTAIQPYGWFSNYYPTYGYYSPYNGYFGHSYGYGYTPVFLNTARVNGVHRPMLGGYVNNSYNNGNSNRNNGRYMPGYTNTGGRYNNRNTGYSNNNNNNYNRSNNSGISNTNSAPARSFTPSSSGSRSSSGGGGGVSRQPRH